MDIRAERLQISDNLRDLASRIRNVNNQDDLLRLLREADECVAQWATYLAALLQPGKEG